MQTEDTTENSTGLEKQSVVATPFIEAEKPEPADALNRMFAETEEFPKSGMTIIADTEPEKSGMDFFNSFNPLTDSVEVKHSEDKDIDKLFAKLEGLLYPNNGDKKSSQKESTITHVSAAAGASDSKDFEDIVCTIHPWTSAHKIKPDQAHWGRAMAALDEISDIVNGQFDKILFLRISTSKGNLKIYANLTASAPAGMARALAWLVDEVESHTKTANTAQPEKSPVKATCDSRFHKPYPWCIKHIIKPSKLSQAHYHVTDAFLARLEEELGDHVNEITYLRIVTVDQKLKIMVDIGRYSNTTSNMGQLIQSLIAQYEDLSDKDDKAARDEIFPGVNEEMSRAVELLRVNPVLMVTVLPDASIEKLKILSQGNADRDHGKRLIHMLQRVKDEKVQIKPLATIADDAFLDKLERESFPHFGELFEFLRNHFALARLGNGALRLPHTALMGEPGIGKTEVLLSLAEHMNTAFMKHDMSSAQTGSVLGGAEIFWSNARQGMLFDHLIFGKTANPIIMLDELDKVAADQKYDPLGPLYSLLERNAASKFVDASLPGVEFDASHIVWFAAGNEVKNINPAIRGRWTILNLPSPTKAQMPTVIRSVYASLRKKETWGPAFPEVLSENVMDRLEAAPPRAIKQIIEAACSKAARARRPVVEPDDICLTPGEKRMGF